MRDFITPLLDSIRIDPQVQELNLNLNAQGFDKINISWKLDLEFKELEK